MKQQDIRNRISLTTDYQICNNSTIILPCDNIEKIPNKIEIKGFPDISRQLNTVIQSNDFKGKKGEIISFSFVNEDKIHDIILVGMTGISSEENDVAARYNIGGSIASSMRKTNKSVYLLDLLYNGSSRHLQEIASGMLQKDYGFVKYLTTEKSKKSAKLRIKKLEIGVRDIESSETLKETQDILSNIYLLKDLVNEPPNELNPESYATIIAETFKDSEIKVKVIDNDELHKMGMNLVTTVGMGSEYKPKVVIMEYNGNKDKKEYDLSLIGKGVTYDSGGLSIKPANSMMDMKSDMAGSAVVFTTMKTMMDLKLKINAVGIVGLVENSINGIAQRPGDIVKSYSGQTVEVLNTDAEGRLVLGDILYYADQQYKSKYMIDLATLTGAIMVALGCSKAGLFSNSNELSDALKNSGDRTGESMWRLPLGQEYNKQLDSDIADMKNISSGRWGGSITAAEFLQRFIGQCKNWAHLDIAGVAFEGKYDDTCDAKGSSGYGIKLLIDFIKSHIIK